RPISPGWMSSFSYLPAIAYFSSQKPWIKGDRECATGWPQTNARRMASAIDRSQFAQFGQQRQQWQPDNVEVIAVNMIEELDALALDLVGADAGQRLFPDPRQMAADKG